LESPDRELRIELGLDQFGRVRYRVLRGDDMIVQDSTLGLESSVESLATVELLEPAAPASPVTDSFELPHGKARQSTLQANTQTIRTDAFELDLWVSDAAVAFRYRLSRPGEAFEIDWERTSFAMPFESRAWLQPHDAPGAYTPAYERLRSRETSASTPGSSPYGWTFPALFHHGDSWTLVTEGALSDGAAGSHFSPAATNGEFLLDFASRGEGNGLGDPRPAATDTWVSPWRIIITSNDLNDIVASNVVRHLAPPPTGDYSWVIPGRVSWSWWSDHESSQDADAVEPFIDLASTMGWEYSLVDANWDRFGYDRLGELADYAAERDVGLMLWYNSGGPNNAVTEAPRELMHDRAVRRAEFERLADIGIRGVKVDFFHSDKPDTIQLYRDILADAAEAQLLVNFHGSTVPRGWSREFPHLLTMEAVRGAEIYTFDRSYQRSAPWQNSVLPFTRNVVGAMDYTPVILGDEVNRRTSNGHELALAVVFESPLLHLVDTPQAYLSQPAEVIDLLSTVPSVWDETRLLSGEPGMSLAMARRHGETWWIGAINPTEEPTQITVDLPTPTGTEIVQVCDRAEWSRSEADTHLDPARYDIQTADIGTQLQLDLVSNGGCLVRISSGP